MKDNRWSRKIFFAGRGRPFLLVPWGRVAEIFLGVWAALVVFAWVGLLTGRWVAAIVVGAIAVVFPFIALLVHHLVLKRALEKVFRIEKIEQISSDLAQE